MVRKTLKTLATAALFAAFSPYLIANADSFEEPGAELSFEELRPYFETAVPSDSSISGYKVSVVSLMDKLSGAWFRFETTRKSATAFRADDIPESAFFPKLRVCDSCEFSWTDGLVTAVSLLWKVGISEVEVDGGAYFPSSWMEISADGVALTGIGNPVIAVPSWAVGITVSGNGNRVSGFLLDSVSYSWGTCVSVTWWGNAVSGMFLSSAGVPALRVWGTAEMGLTHASENSAFATFSSGAMAETNSVSASTVSSAGVAAVMAFSSGTTLSGSTLLGDVAIAFSKGVTVRDNVFSGSSVSVKLPSERISVVDNDFASSRATAASFAPYPGVSVPEGHVSEGLSFDWNTVSEPNGFGVSFSATSQWAVPAYMSGVSVSSNSFSATALASVNFDCSHANAGINDRICSGFSVVSNVVSDPNSSMYDGEWADAFASAVSVRDRWSYFPDSDPVWQNAKGFSFRNNTFANAWTLATGEPRMRYGIWWGLPVDEAPDMSWNFSWGHRFWELNWSN